jgi:hypothetical protein
LFYSLFILLAHRLDRYEWAITNYYFYIVFVCSILLTGLGCALQYLATAKGFNFQALLEEVEASTAMKEREARELRIPLRSPVNH